MNKHFASLLSAGVLSGLVAACTPSANAPSIPSATLAPTGTTAPGATPTPVGATPTPAPTTAPTPTPTPPVTMGSTTTSFVISLNGGGETILSKQRKPQFVSPSTQSITFAIDGGATTTQNVSASATNCASSNGGVKCTIPLANVAAGAHALSLTTWSGTNGTGNKLGANSSIAFTVVANQANTVSGVIGGIATGINIVPVSGATGSMTQGFIVYDSATPAQFVAYPVDAAGNAIVGPGAPTTSASLNSSTANAAAGTAQNSFTITVTAGYTQPQLVNLGQLTVQLTPVANSGGTALSATVGVSGQQPRIYVVGANEELVSYDEQGNLQTDPGPSDNIDTVFNTTAIAWDPTSQLLVASTATQLHNYDWPGGNVSNIIAQGAVVPARNVLAWDDVSQLAFEYDTVSGKLATVGPWPNPTTITLLGASSLGAPYTALAWSGSTPGGGQNQDQLFGATSSLVALVQTSGATNVTIFASPNVGVISGLSYDPATEKLFVAGSTGATYYTNFNLSSSPGFSGVTGATGIAFNPANGLVYVAEGASSKIVAFNESGVQQFSFSTGSIVPQQIIVVP